MEIILTHENGDFDGVAGILAASKLYPNALPVLPERLNQNVARFITLYESALPFVRQAVLRPKAVSRIILVDTQRPFKIKAVKSSVPTEVIDHHPLSHDLPPTYIFSHEPVGAVTTLLVERIKQASISLTTLEATLLLVGIYEDTGSLVYGTTTSRDLQAASWLLEQGAVLDTVRRFLTPPLNEEQQRLFEQLIQRVDTRNVQGYSVSVSSIEWPEHIPEISSVAHRMRDLLDSAALFVIVAMPTGALVVARSMEDGVDVGEVARELGGGGHGRAAAATVRGRTLREIINSIWEQLELQIVPSARVADLMSYGVQSVESTQSLGRIIRQLRQIGHEGYPVTEKGKLVGLLTRRDLDRADEHGMRDLAVRDVMSAGYFTLNPSDTISDLEKLMQDSGWGQIPVEDDSGKLIGIVTRTDLIKHWSRRHPTAGQRERIISAQQIESILGPTTNQLIQHVASFARSQGITLYLVGGFVRDLLLGRPNFDIDFVVEGDAILFSHALQQEFGGQITIFRPFGTAKWLLDKLQLASVSSGDENALPDHIDFASSRYEFYEYPSALPTVYNSSIKLDLQRRDFTINTLAVQLSPTTKAGRVLDFFGGLRDLESGIVRVLHSLSFIDDATRILRAVRFEHRLNFAVEPRTAELMNTALPMLERITGERLRNELDLLLQEHEPEQGLLVLQERGILSAIHKQLAFNDEIATAFRRTRSADFPWPTSVKRWAELYWRLWIVQLSSEALDSICSRLLIGGGFREDLEWIVRIVTQNQKLIGTRSPSQIVDTLTGIGELELLVVWLAIDNTQAKENIRLYWLQWQHVKPVTTGAILLERGLTPGPCYGKILKHLRDAWLDGLVHEAADELALLERLLQVEGICNDNK
ncbi:MAG: CBS domain-containing protein [Anaerolineae bacterium]